MVAFREETFFMKRCLICVSVECCRLMYRFMYDPDAEPRTQNLTDTYCYAVGKYHNGGLRRYTPTSRSYKSALRGIGLYTHLKKANQRGIIPMSYQPN